MSRSEVQIQRTSDSCTLSKCSMAERGYWKDSYIKDFVTKSLRRSPLIHLGYYTRAVVINNSITSFFNFVETSPAQIISCGAGFDSNYFVLAGSKQLTSNIVYVEIDYPDIVRRKKHCINNSVTLKELVGDIGTSANIPGINTKHYKLIGCDLKGCRELSEALNDSGIDFSLPTLFLSECSITYMKEEDSSNFIKWVAQNFENASFLSYEQIHPNDGFGQVMLNHFKKLHSPLLSISKFPDLLSQQERYVKLGWSSCSANSVMEIYFQILPRQDQINILSLEPFDEFEEWNLKCSHYSLAVATKGILEGWKPLDKIIKSNTIRYPQAKCIWTLIDGNLQRFYHASGLINENEVLIVGGFGPLNNGGNSRISEVSLIRLNDSEASYCKTFLPVEGSEGINLARVHHSCNMMRDGRFIIFGGRTSPLKPLSDCFTLTINETQNSPKLREIKLEQLEFSHNTPCPRWRFSAAIVEYDGIEELLVFGGRADCAKDLGDLWSLNTESFMWGEEASDNGPEPRFSHSAAFWKKEKKMLITGGISCRGHEYSMGEIWSWDCVSKKWEKIKLSADYNYVFSRFGHSSLVVTDNNGHDLLVVLGGVNAKSGQQSGIAVFNLQVGNLREFSLLEPSPDYPLMLINHTCHILPDRSGIIVIGGGGTCFSFGTSFNRYIIKINVPQLFS